MNKHNQTLLTSLYQDYQGMVYQMCLGFVKGDKDLADDLTQEVFINIWNALDKFRGASSYKTWIYRTTVNTCLKFIRDKKNASNVTLEEMKIGIPNEPEIDRTYQNLYQAIGELHEVDRLIIMMVLDELEYEEISNVMGISEPSLRVKIHRIKKKLKTLLRNEN
jgi:RNA polymerase sigma-70 factor (ECF subfamily)